MTWWTPLGEEELMSLLTSCAPHPALAEHPEFALMLARTLERYHCTLAEVREDYWISRAWRALTADRSLSTRVARTGLCNILVTGPNYGSAPMSARDRDRWQMRVLSRLVVDTGRTAEALGLEVRFAETPVEIAGGSILSLISQTVAGDPRWQDLTPYAADLSPVQVPVACSAEAFVAA
jgi:hypothetical protein